MTTENVQYEISVTVTGQEAVEQLRNSMMNLQKSSKDMSNQVQGSTGNVTKSVTGMGQATKESGGFMKDLEGVGETMSIRLDKLATPLRTISNLFAVFNPYTLIASAGLTSLVAGFTSLTNAADKYMVSGASVTTLINQYTADNMSLREVQADIKSQSDALSISVSELESAYSTALPVVKDYGVAEGIIADAVKIHKDTGLPLQQVVKDLVSAYSDGLFTVTEFGSQLVLGADAVEALKDEMNKAKDPAVSFRTSVNDAFEKIPDDIKRWLGEPAANFSADIKGWILRIFTPDKWWEIVANNLPEDSEELEKAMNDLLAKSFGIDDDHLSQEVDRTIGKFIDSLIEHLEDVDTESTNAIKQLVLDMVAAGYSEEEIRRIVLGLPWKQIYGEAAAETAEGGKDAAIAAVSAFEGNLKGNETQAQVDEWIETALENLSPKTQALFERALGPDFKNIIRQYLADSMDVDQKELESHGEEFGSAVGRTIRVTSASEVKEATKHLREDAVETLFDYEESVIHNQAAEWTPKVARQMFKAEYFNEAARNSVMDVSSEMGGLVEETLTTDFDASLLAGIRTAFDPAKTNEGVDYMMGDMSIKMHDVSVEEFEKYHAYLEDMIPKAFDASEEVAEAFSNSMTGAEAESIAALNEEFRKIKIWFGNNAHLMTDRESVAEAVRDSFLDTADNAEGQLKEEALEIARYWQDGIDNDVFSQDKTRAAAKKAIYGLGTTVARDLEPEVETASVSWWQKLNEKMFNSTLVDNAIAGAFGPGGQAMWRVVKGWLWDNSVIPDYWNLVNTEWLNKEKHDTQAGLSVEGIGDKITSTLASPMDTVKTWYHGILENNIFSKSTTETTAVTSVTDVNTEIKDKLDNTKDPLITSWTNMVKDTLFNKGATETAAKNSFANVGTKVWNTIKGWMKDNSVIPDYWKLLCDELFNPTLHDQQGKRAVAGVGDAMWTEMKPDLDTFMASFDQAWGTMERRVVEPIARGVTQAETVLRNLTLSIEGIAGLLGPPGSSFAGPGGRMIGGHDGDGEHPLKRWLEGSNLWKQGGREAYEWTGEYTASGRKLYRNKETGNLVDSTGATLSYDSEGNYVGPGGTHSLNDHIGKHFPWIYRGDNPPLLPGQLPPNRRHMIQDEEGNWVVDYINWRYDSSTGGWVRRGGGGDDGGGDDGGGDDGGYNSRDWRRRRRAGDQSTDQYGDTFAANAAFADNAYIYDRGDMEGVSDDLVVGDGEKSGKGGSPFGFFSGGPYYRWEPGLPGLGGVDGAWPRPPRTPIWGRGASGGDLSRLVECLEKLCGKAAREIDNPFSPGPILQPPGDNPPFLDDGGLEGDDVGDSIFAPAGTNGRRRRGGTQININIDGRRFEQFVIGELERRVRLRGAR